MTTKLTQDGNGLTATLVGNVTVNNLYAVACGLETATGGIPAVAAQTGTTGDVVNFLIEGVYTLTKVAEAASALKVGQRVYWRTTGGANVITGKATGALGTVGTAYSVAATGGTSAQVKLLGHASFIV